MTGGIACKRCGDMIPVSFYNRDSFFPCSKCNTQTMVRVYPALYSGKNVNISESISEGESVCFYHPENTALISCESCGRFLCSVCDIEFDGSHICPGCLEEDRKKRRILNLDSSRTLYDSISLKLSFYPLILFPITIFTAPISFYLAVRYFKIPASIVSRSKYKFIAAIIISSMQILGWAYVFSLIFT
ncbi:MAG TPA: hypothetical protein VIS94_01810 [Desulfomonilia bacterium]